MTYRRHLPSVQFVLGQVVRQDENSQELVAHARELYRVYRELLTTILERRSGCACLYSASATH